MSWINFYLREMRKLEELENGKIKKKKTIKVNDKLITLFINNYYSSNDNYSCSQKSLNVDENVSIIDTFPNALLLEYEEKPKEKKVEKVEKVNNLRIKKENIWDVLEELDAEKEVSESLDVLSSDSKPEKVTKSCTSCGSTDAFIEDHRTSSLVCTNCGSVNEELLDYSPEWRQYNNDDNRGDGVNRCGCSINPFFPKSSQGTFLVGANNNRINRKQKWGCLVYKEKSLNEVCEKITSVCNKNGINKIIIDDAKILYKKVSDCKHKEGGNAGKQMIIRGINRKSIIAACVFKSCEKNKKPKNIKEIAKMFQLDEKKVTKGIKNLDNVIKNSDDKNFFYDQFQESDVITDCIRDRCPNLNIYGDDIELAVRIANNCCRMKLASDHNPESIAAGSVLVAVNYCNLDIEKKKIAKIFDTTDVTIGKIFQKINRYVETLIDNKATDNIIKKFKING